MPCHGELTVSSNRIIKVGCKNSANIEYVAKSRIWFLNNAKPKFQSNECYFGGLGRLANQNLEVIFKKQEKKVFVVLSMENLAFHPLSSSFFFTACKT